MSLHRPASSQPARASSVRGSLAAIKVLVSQLTPYRGRFALALTALMAGGGINLAFPEIIRRALDPSVFPWILEHLGRVMGLLALLFIVQGISFYVRSYLFGLIGQQVFSDVRGKLFRSIISRDVLFFDLNRSGDLASRINADAALVQDAVSIKLSVILRYGLQVVVGTILMAWMSWRMTAAIVASVICMVLISSIFVRSLRAASRAFQGALARLTGFAAECFAGAKVVHALGAQDSAGRTFEAMNSDVLKRGRRRVLVGASFSSGAGLVFNLLLLGVQWYGIHLVISNDLPLNSLAAFALYGAIVAVSFSFLVSAYAELMQSIGGLDRVFELIAADPGPSAARGRGFAPIEDLSVELHDVSFSYPSRPDVPVLHKLSFALRAGAITGLVGPSGSGKSSIAQLLLRLYSVASGKILLNGTAIEEIPEGVIRASVAWVPQEPFLFGFSVYENLTFGNEQLLRDEVIKAVREWGFLDFIDTLPDGIDTVLGEQGAQLSGGQRQRLAIARAILRRPSLLILDEATSGLDSQTEQRVLEAIRIAVPSTTLLVISHRLSTVRHASTIVVISDGAVFEQGSHEQLSVRQGLYQQYVARQALG